MVQTRGRNGMQMVARKKITPRNVGEHTINALEHGVALLVAPSIKLTTEMQLCEL
jgi:hypothetical protein